MNNITIELSNEELDKIDLRDLDKYLAPKLRNPKEYNFHGDSGREHYKMLSHISKTFNDITILDVGTHMAGSSLALSTNPTNKIKSVDIVDRRQTTIDVPNIEFYIGDITDKDLGHGIIKDSSIILYDTIHDGIIETEFHNLLLDLNWNGIVIWDDITYRWTGEIRQGMVDFWNNISNPKYDVTKYAHWTGTGIVEYGKTKLNLIEK